MTDLQALAFAVGILALTLPGALVYLAVRVRGMVSVTVNQPPIEVRPNITVQAPTALLPDRVEQILSEVNEKLHPAKPALSLEEQEVALTKIVGEARLVAEQFASNNAANGHTVTDGEKQREAMRYAKQRIQDLNMQVDYSVVAGRLESEVRKAKEIQS